MKTQTDYPGTAQHQALLKAIANYYQGDSRILAISLFGSLSRGAWDAYSDVDLDIVVADDVRLQVLEELNQLCNAVELPDAQGAIIIADGNDAGDVVFTSLLQLSVRYHALATTNPKIVDSLHVIAGRLDQGKITAAGRSNRQPPVISFEGLLNQSVRYVTNADIALQRRQLWSAIEMLHRLRQLFMELYALGHGAQRALRAFQSDMTPELQERLGSTLPQFNMRSLQDSLKGCIQLLQQDLDHFTRNQIQLTAVQQKILAQVRARQAKLKSGG